MTLSQAAFSSSLKPILVSIVAVAVVSCVSRCLQLVCVLLQLLTKFPCFSRQTRYQVDRAELSVFSELIVYEVCVIQSACRRHDV